MVRVLVEYFVGIAVAVAVVACVVRGVGLRATPRHDDDVTLARRVDCVVSSQQSRKNWRQRLPWSNHGGRGISQDPLNDCLRMACRGCCGNQNGCSNSIIGRCKY